MIVGAVSGDGGLTSLYAEYALYNLDNSLLFIVLYWEFLMLTGRPSFWFPNNPRFQSYSKVMENISPDQLYEGLLGYGLFSDNLPPIFTSENFFSYVNRKPNLVFQSGNTEYIHYECARNNGDYRSFGIPNPFGYANLCYYLAQKWVDLQTHYKKYTAKNHHKISRIHIRSLKGTKKIFQMNYKHWENDEDPFPDLQIGAKYIVLADISTCFPSIYTHSISWALTNKAIAKQNKDDQNWWPNILDKKIRQIKNGETHGLLIGPHTSNLLSELILVVIDQNLFEAKFKFIRKIDDYECYADSHEEAQLFHQKLREELRNFDLTLNNRKFSVIELPRESASQWTNKLSNASYLNHKKVWTFSETKGYLDLAIDLLHKNEQNASILLYAMKVIANKQLTKPAMLYAQKVFLHLSIIYPYLIPHMEEHVLNPLKVNPQVIRKWVIYQWVNQFSLKNFDALSYMIYFAIRYKFSINSIDVQEIIDSSDCMLKTISLLYYRNYKNTVALGKLRKHAIELTSNAQDFDRNWLFIYEALHVNELTGDWNKLKKARVTFFK